MSLRVHFDSGWIELTDSGLAYEDISGSGPNGGMFRPLVTGPMSLPVASDRTDWVAIPHYAPQRGTDRVIEPDTTYVMYV